MQAVLAFIVFNLLLQAKSSEAVNDRPIIGVLTQETGPKDMPGAKSKVYASYIKYIEAGGARVVPVWINKSREYYEDLLSNINGVLFPGGPMLLNSDGYGRTGQLIYNIATGMNKNGDYFPLWGTCLGFELLNFLVSGKELWMKACDANDLPTNIPLIKGYKDSKLFQDLDSSLENKMHKEKVVIHYHQWCLTPKNYTLSGLDKYFKVLAVNQDSRNVTFVSIVEAHNYPYYGVSFHPEKIQFEWAESKSVHNAPHSFDAVRVSQFFSNFFVNEARKSYHHFPNKTAEDDAMIFNYSPVFTGRYRTPTQMYYFNQ